MPEPLPEPTVAGATPPRPASPWRLMGRTLAWLPAAFALWFALAFLWLLPVRWLVAPVLALLLGDVYAGLSSEGLTWNLQSTLGAGMASDAGRSALVVSASPLLYGYGLALWLALAWAAGGIGTVQTWRRIGLGYLLLIPGIALGIGADLLKQLALGNGGLGGHVASQLGWSPWARELLVLVYQLATLILPSLLPVLVWVWLFRDFLQMVRQNTNSDRFKR